MTVYNAFMTLIEQIAAAAKNPKKVLTCDSAADRNRHSMALRSKVMGSQRFSVDYEVSRMAARLGIDNPDILMGMLRDARLPFNKIWIEWSNKAHIEELGDHLADGAPERIGAFIEKIDDQKPIYRMTICAVIPEQGNSVAEAALKNLYKSMHS